MSLLKLIKNNLQTVYLFSAQIFGLVVGFLSNVFLAKELGATSFGLYSFIAATIGFVAIFFEFGLFTSGARILAKSNSLIHQRELMGMISVVVLLMSILFSGTIFSLSFFIDHFFSDKIGDSLRIVSVISFAFILPAYMELTLKGTNHIEYLSGFNLLWKLLYSGLIVVLYFSAFLTPLYLAISFCASCIVSSFLFIVVLKPSFKNLGAHLAVLRSTNKEYGIHIYWGRIVDVGTYQLDRILISYFSKAAFVGYYGLAYSIANPINTLSYSLAASKFKEFATGAPISEKIIKFNVLATLVCMMLSYGGGLFIVYFILGDEYNSVIPILLFLVFAVGCQSLYQPYNNWLMSNGFGKKLRNIAFKLAMVSLVGNFILIPLMGGVGAGIASLLNMFLSFVLYYRCYKAIQAGA